MSEIFDQVFDAFFNAKKDGANQIVLGGYAWAMIIEDIQLSQHWYSEKSASQSLFGLPVYVVSEMPKGMVKFKNKDKKTVGELQLI